MEGWALVEIMGHKRYAGRVSEELVIGAPMLRVDVPAIRELPAFTKYFAAGAIYGITPCTETEAHMLAEGIGERAVPAMFTGRLLTGPFFTDDAEEVEDEDDPPHDFVGVPGNEGGCDPCTACGLGRSDSVHTVLATPSPMAVHAAIGDGVTCRCGRPLNDPIHDDVPF